MLAGFVKPEDVKKQAEAAAASAADVVKPKLETLKKLLNTKDFKDALSDSKIALSKFVEDNKKFSASFVGGAVAAYALG